MKKKMAGSGNLNWERNTSHSKWSQVRRYLLKTQDHLKWTFNYTFPGEPSKSNLVIFFISLSQMVYFHSQACSKLIKTWRATRHSTQDRTPMETGGAWKCLRSVITIPTGAPPLGMTLLSWSVTKKQSSWWKTTWTAGISTKNVSYFQLNVVKRPKQLLWPIGNRHKQRKKPIRTQSTEIHVMASLSSAEPGGGGTTKGHKRYGFWPGLVWNRV